VPNVHRFRVCAILASYPFQQIEVIVGNVRELRAISHSDRKSDKVDAEKIARYARVEPEILRPIAHRTVAQQETLTLIRARDLQASH
jgi:transposase